MKKQKQKQNNKRKKKQKKIWEKIKLFFNIQAKEHVSNMTKGDKHVVTPPHKRTFISIKTLFYLYFILVLYIRRRNLLLYHLKF